MNDASLRVRALDTLYEFDFSVDQLNDLRTTASGGADSKKRSPAKTNTKLAIAQNNFRDALLDGKDGERIDKLRNEVADLVDDDNVELDDAIALTAVARSKAPQVCRKITSSQMAAYLASHADEVGDPLELMMSTAEELRDLRNGGGGKDSDAGVEAANLMHVTSTDIGYLVAGVDEAKARAVINKADCVVQSSQSDDRRRFRQPEKSTVGIG